MTDKIMVIITASSAEESENIVKVLLNEKLIACGNITYKVNSHYWWQGSKQNESEYLIFCKSKASLLDKIVEQVKAIHSYDVPEIIAMPIVGGNEDYLNWIESETV